MALQEGESYSVAQYVYREEQYFSVGVFGTSANTNKWEGNSL